MQKIRISKRRQPGKQQPEPLSLDLRDHDIMRAKRLAGPFRPVQHDGARSRRAD